MDAGAAAHTDLPGSDRLGEFGTAGSKDVVRDRTFEMSPLVEDSVPADLRRLSGGHVVDPHTVTSVLRIADEDTFEGTAAKGALFLLLGDVGGAEGDAQMAKVGHFVSEVLDGGDVSEVGGGGCAVEDVVGHTGSEAPVCRIETSVHGHCGNHGSPGIPVLLDGAELPVVVGPGHVGVNAKCAQLGAKAAIEGCVTVEDHVIDVDPKFDAHEVAKDNEGSNSGRHGLVDEVLFVHIAADGVAESDEACTSAALGTREAAFEVTNAGAISSRASGVFTIGRSRTRACSNLGEEVDGHGEALHAHGRRRREAETAVGDQETNIGKAVMLSVLEMRRRSVVEQPATAPSRGNRCIAGRSSGCFDAEVLGDSVTTRTHARAFSATTDEGVGGGVREMLR